MMSDPKKTKDEVVQWIHDYFADNGPMCSAVIGISGGKDSTVVAALCVEALGKDRVFGVMMPNGVQSDIDDSIQVVEALGITNITVNISDAYEKLMAAIGSRFPNGTSEQAKINLPPRLRMATLYAVAQSLPNGGRVANTCNMSEDYVGYSTKFGDSAGDFSPLANLTVNEVRQIGCILSNELSIPAYLIQKSPSDGLCGKTDEDNLGFTYKQLDTYITTGTCGDEEVDSKISCMHKANLHKLRLMPSFKQTKSEEGSQIYVLHSHWDTPDTEGNEVVGVFLNLSDAFIAMKSAAETLKAEYPSDYWEEDFTWQDEFEIHLGSQKGNSKYATIYCWTISEVVVQ